MIKIIDNFFEKADDIEILFKGVEFSWFYVDYTSGLTVNPNSNPAVSAILKNIQNKNKELKFYDYLLFSHSFYGFIENKNITSLNSEKEYLNIIKDIVNAANKKLGETYTEKNIIRSKANLQTQANESGINHLNPPHIDMKIPHYVMLYYVNDSDGDTFFFADNGKLLKKITPKKGRLVYFDGSIYHASSNPIKFRDRMAINIDLDYNYGK